MSWTGQSTSARLGRRSAGRGPRIGRRRSLNCGCGRRSVSGAISRAGGLVWADLGVLQRLWSRLRYRTSSDCSSRPCPATSTRPLARRSSRSSRRSSHATTPLAETMLQRRRTARPHRSRTVSSGGSRARRPRSTRPAPVRLASLFLPGPTRSTLPSPPTTLSKTHPSPPSPSLSPPS